MNQKKAKQLRKTAKSIYPGETAYDDVHFSVSPEDKDKYPEWVDGMLAKRELKEGCTRKMYQDLKSGAKSRLVEFEYKTPKGLYNARRYRKLLEA